MRPPLFQRRPPADGNHNGDSNDNPSALPAALDASAAGQVAIAKYKWLGGVVFSSRKTSAAHHHARQTCAALGMLYIALSISLLSIIGVRLYALHRYPIRYKTPQLPLAVNATFLRHLKALEPIPKIIHLSYFRSPDELWSSDDPLFRHGVQNLRKLNPDWTIDFASDDAVDSYLESHLSPADYRLVRRRHIVEKVDLWRLLKIYHEGGYYQDVDRLNNVPLHSIIANDTRMLLPTYGRSFSQDMMCSAKHNDVFLRAIELNIEYRKRCWNIYETGVHSYFLAVSEVVFGQPIDIGIPMDDMRGKLEEEQCKPWIVTGRETFDDSLVFRRDNVKEDDASKEEDLASTERAIKARYKKEQIDRGSHWQSLRGNLRQRAKCLPFALLGLN